MNILSENNLNNAHTHGKFFLFICVAVVFFSLFTYTVSEANMPYCHTSKSSIAGLLPFTKTDTDVFLGKYGRETLNYMVLSFKIEPGEIRLAPKTISIKNLFLTEKTINKINITLLFSSYIICPDSANHLRA
jgi:hypothetical protein